LNIQLLYDAEGQFVGPTFIFVQHQAMYAKETSIRVKFQDMWT